MSKLHEILAVEQSLESSSKMLTKEAMKNLGKEHLFKGHVKSHQVFREDESHLKQSDEVVPVDSTAMEILDYIIKPVSKYWDCVLQKECTNQSATATLTIGTTDFNDLPATFLLGLESKLKSLREVYNNIPTLTPAMTWIPNESAEKPGIFITATPEERFQTRNENDFITVSEATDHHPAQIREVSKTVNVGKFLVTYHSGMMKPVDKAAILERLDTLIQETKKARMRANNVEVVKANIGESIFKYLHTGQ